jgi:hypothetical protein
MVKAIETPAWIKNHGDSFTKGAVGTGEAVDTMLDLTNQ